MKKSNKMLLYSSLVLLIAFTLWTVSVMLIDVKPVGPFGSPVGFSRLNTAFHKLTGDHMTLYIITDWLGLVPIAIALGFAVLGLMQWIKRRSILKVDRSILALGGLYIATLAAYILFEFIAVNHRPVLINGTLEASYPSSTTLLVMCVMPTAMHQLSTRINNGILRRSVLLSIFVFTAFTVIARLLSGVHWLSDIIGGALLAGALVTAYYALN